MAATNANQTLSAIQTFTGNANHSLRENWHLVRKSTHLTNPWTGDKGRSAPEA